MASFRKLVRAAALLVAVIAAANAGQNPLRGESALIDAAEDGNLSTVEALLASGTDANERDGHQSTALHYAAMRGDMRMAELLLANKAYIDTLPKRSWETRKVQAVTDQR